MALSGLMNRFSKTRWRTRRNFKVFLDSALAGYQCTTVIQPAMTGASRDFDYICTDRE